MQMTRQWGRAPKGERVLEATPQGHWGGVDHAGSHESARRGGGMTVESATDGDVFSAYSEQVFCPKLRPDDVVVMDNLSAHKVTGYANGSKPAMPICSICSPIPLT